MKIPQVAEENSSKTKQIAWTAEECEWTVSYD